jgi:gliding motility-associated transport system permease protein/gliding motility-associatede transport system auxiliary component
MVLQQIFLQLAWLALYDLIFVAVLLLLLVPLKIYRQAAFAVLRRNFVAYFANPTGYVFLCFFVLLTSLAAFWPNEFFVRNLANLDQLNLWLPFIMLVFIPAITMSIWADERRQGTDELLLTLPAGDFDIVIGKYLAAAAVFTVSLLFSQYANFSVLISLAQGQVDTGLYFTTYLGYWFIGLAMLAIGMVASFLTNNLTVGFILGGLFNAPLVFAVYADTILPANFRPHWVSRWSFSERFDDFGRGVISLSAVSYFALIVALGIYLSMVLIGRRHWLGGRDGQSMLGHYVVRALALVGLLVGANVVFSNHDLMRQDLTAGQVGSLSPDTVKILASLKNKSPVKIEAFLSARVPEEYVKTKYNLVSMLKELERYAGSKVSVALHDNLEEFSKEATLAEERFGIHRVGVRIQERGESRTQEFILGAAFTCGVEKVVVPFFSNGMPVEYELVRSIATVAQPQRKKLGVVQTDAQLKGGFTFAGGQPRQIEKQMILDDLGRQYRIEDVDATSPIQVFADDGSLRYDALLVVQPSSLSPPQLQNLVEAIKQGQPAVIFEDPLPYIFEQTVGTNEDKPSPGGMFGGGPPQPKGEAFKMLWEALGIAPIGESTLPGTLPGKVVCQAGNPYRRFADMPKFGPFIFVRQENPGSFNSTQPAVAGFEELLFPFSGGIVQESDRTDLKFTELVNTAKDGTSTIDAEEMRLFVRGGGEELIREKLKRTPERAYTIAAWIREEAADSGDAKSKDAKDEREPKASESKDGKQEEKAKASGGKDGQTPPSPAQAKYAPKKKPMSVIYVADIDCLHNQWFMYRNSPGPDQFRWDNGPFVLNLIDAVAGEDRFLAIRQRKPRYSTLQRIEMEAREAGEREDVEAEKFQKKYNDALAKQDENVKKLEKKLTDLRADREKRRNAGEVIDLNEEQAKETSLALQLVKAQADAAKAREELQRDLAKNLETIRRERDQTVRSVQNEYKLWSVAIPPIPPLLVGFIVFVRRRLREREGIAKTRLKY